MATRRFFLALGLGLPAMLAGCGWEPLYANRETAPASADLRAIRVSPIPERVGQRLEMALRSTLNPSGEPAQQHYMLYITLSTSLANLGIQSQGLGTRGEVQVFATYRLVDIASGKQLQVSTVHAADSFDIQANGYSTIVAQDDAYTRCVVELNNEIVARLTLFMQDHQTS
jgi:LPS-assembly lipoprotein